MSKNLVLELKFLNQPPIVIDDKTELFTDCDIKLT